MALMNYYTSVVSPMLICTIRVWYNNPYHTRMVIPYAYTHMVCTIRVRYKYAYGTEQLTNKDLFTFEQAICSQFAIGKDSGFSVWIYVAEETEEEAEVHASKIRIGAKIDETKFIEVTNPSLKEQFLEEYGYKKTKQYDFYGYKPTMKPFTRPKN